MSFSLLVVVVAELGVGNSGVVTFVLSGTIQRFYYLIADWTLSPRLRFATEAKRCDRLAKKGPVHVKSVDGHLLWTATVSATRYLGEMPHVTLHSADQAGARCRAIACPQLGHHNFEFCGNLSTPVLVLLGSLGAWVACIWYYAGLCVLHRVIREVGFSVLVHFRNFSTNW